MITKITFKLENDMNTSVAILQDGKQVGRVWSEHSDGTTPFAHDKCDRTLNSIQVCGFDRQSEVWACGPFEGKRDTVFSFITDGETGSLSKYKEYVKWYTESGNDMAKLRNFSDWRLHHY